MRARLATILRPTENYGATSPRAVATNGAQIVMIGYRKLYASNKGGKFKLLGPRRPPVRIADHDTGLLQFDSGVAFDGDAIWVCGYRGVARSRDRGATFQVVPAPKSAGGLPALAAIACSEDHEVWAAGDHGNLCVYRGGAKFQRVRGVGDSAIHALVPSPLGVLVANDAGELYAAAGSKVRKLALAAGGPLYAACVTPLRTIIAVGARGAYRAVDGTPKFRKITLPIKAELHAVAALPDGRVAVGGDEGHLLVSADDGVTFQPLRGGKHARAPKRGVFAFDYARPYRDGVLIGGPCQGLLYMT